MLPPTASRSQAPAWLIVFLVVAVLCSISLPAAAPEENGLPGTGLDFDEVSYRGTPYKATFTAETYANLPPRASLEKYCPTPGDQGQFGTCVAFAVGYHMRTVIYGIEKQITDRATLDRAIFSPTYVYEKIKKEGDRNCQGGSNPILALELLRTEGIPRLTTVPYHCGAEIGAAALMEALDYPILDYQTLFASDEPSAEVRINATKKALAENSPVVLGFKVVKSFYTSGKVWRRLPSDSGAEGKHGAHAMLVVGYDDTVAGGAFRVINSWGPKWGDGGFVWIPYADYAAESLCAIQAYGLNPPPPQPPPAPAPKPSPAPTPPPTPSPAPAPVLAQLQGDVFFKLRDGTPMNASRILTRNLTVENDTTLGAEDLVAYRMDRSYPSGTRFRFFASTNTQTYLYAFATDLGGKINQILPFTDGMSALLGPDSTVAFPSEKKVVRMDQNPGTDYLLILYTDRALDPKDLKAKIDAASGSLSDRARAALGQRLVPKGAVTYAADRIAFTRPKAATGAVVPLMIEIAHD